MASLTTLPTELLTQILTDQTLTTIDISNCALTSRRLYNLTADRKTKYSFHIDHRSQSTWKLITCILSNPRIGHRIHRIIITWHRRNPHKPKSWTPQWLWKSQELEQIKSICEKHGVEFLYPVIEDGFNSEALLPFLLCLTPNLQSLDFGAIVPSIMHRAKILLLPNLETASFHGAVAFDPTKAGCDYKPLSATLEFTAGKKSSVKELEIINCDLERSDYSTLAELTGSLEVLSGSIVEYYHWWRSGNKLAHMVNTFKESNPRTLSANKISVKRSNHRDLAFKSAPDVYFPFRAQDEREDMEEMAQRFKEEEEGREYSESLIWKDDEDEDENQEEEDDEYICDHESECGCDYYFYNTEYGGEDDDPYWTDLEGDDDVVLRTRDIKGSKQRSHFVKVI
ncbi:hypothetical protein TWF173_004050 [Orbilia oligospora]|nr:hypothetical protein TWF173_004050 [Orbilia oligospora]